MSLRLKTENYREFFGRITEQIPKLIAEGRTLLSVSELMKKRLEVLNPLNDNYDKEVEELFWDRDFDTGDCIAHHPDGIAKIVLDAQPLRELNPESRLLGDSLVLKDFDGL